MQKIDIHIKWSFHQYTYYVLVFVPTDLVRLKNNIWFSKLSNKQVLSVEKVLKTKKSYMELSDDLQHTFWSSFLDKTLLIVSSRE